jgi:hypothetical protein
VNAPLLPRRTRLWDTVRAVAWSFIGVRRRSDFQDDVNKLNPLHLMAVGFGMTVLFVIGLILLVNWVAG